MFQKGYGAVTITDFDQGNSGTFSQNEGDLIQLNGFSGQPTVSYLNGNTIADFGGGDILTLLNVTQSEIAALNGSEFVSNNGNGGNNNGPAISNAGNTVTYAGAPVLLDPSIAVSDSTNTVTAVNAWISSGFQNGDLLTINGSIDGDSWIQMAALSITITTIRSRIRLRSRIASGTATLSDFDAALQSIQFSNTTGDPTAGGTDTSRTVTWAAHDSVNATSPTVTTTINVTTVDIVPVLGIPAQSSATIQVPAGTPDAIGGYVPVIASNNFTFTDADLSDTHTVNYVFDANASSLGPLDAPVGEFSATLGHDSTNGNAGFVDWTFTLDSVDLLHLNNAGLWADITEVYDVTVDDGHGGTATRQVSIAINGTLFPATTQVISGSISAGALNFTPESSEMFQLQGATISGSAGNVLSIQSSDPSSSHAIVVEADQASSIAVSGHNGMAINTGGAGIVVFNAASSIAASGTGSIGIDASANGNVAVNDLSNTSVSGDSYGIAAFAQGNGHNNVAVNVYSNATIGSTSSYGVLAFNTSTGNIAVTTDSGDIINSGSAGINAVNEDASIAANSVIDVTAFGTINSGNILTGNQKPPAGILAGYLGGSTIPSSIPVPGLNGNVFVNSSADINAAAGDGIRAYNYGTGDVTVNDNAGTIHAFGGTLSDATPTPSGYGDGISADNFGTGNIYVTTAVSTAIHSAGSGIAANNAAPSSQSTSVIDIVAHGTITSSNDILSGDGNPAAGILAGYKFDSVADSSDHGNLIIDDYGSITATGGADGIRGYNYGTGTISITVESGAIIDGSR